MWTDLQLFEVAARSGSMTAAARELGLGQATLSRRLGGLEARLGHRLFDRGPRGLTLTVAGRSALPYAQAMARAARGLGHELEHLEATPSGSVRLALPPGVGQHGILPMIPRLRARHPELSLELLVSTEVVDLVAGQADIALRSVRPSHPELVAVHLFDSGQGVWAAPSYAQGLAPNTPLPSLDWIGWPESHRHIHQARLLQKHLPQAKWVLRSDNFALQCEAVRMGLGVCLMGDVLGQVMGLQRLGDFGSTPVQPAFAVLHRELRAVPRVRAVVEFLKQEVKGWMEGPGISMTPDPTGLHQSPAPLHTQTVPASCSVPEVGLPIPSSK